MNANMRAREVLRDAIVMELEGKRFFEHASGRMSRKRSKEMFMGLVAQEKRHVDVLRRELSRLESGRGWCPLDEVERDSGQEGSSSVFSDTDVKQLWLSLKPDAGELEVIDLGMEVEKRSIELYRSAGSEIGDPAAKQIFDWLVDEESGHLAILQAERDSRTGSGFHYDNMEFSLETE